MLHDALYNFIYGYACIVEHQNVNLPYHDYDMSFSHINILSHVFMLGNFIEIIKFKMVCFYSWVEYSNS